MKQLMDHPKFTEICQQFGVARLTAFGSVVAGGFVPGQSDYDFFVEFRDTEWRGSFARYMGLKLALEDLLQANVDLVEPEAIRNPIFRDVAGRHTLVVYAA